MTTDTDPSLNGHASDAEQRVLDALGNPFSAASLAVLEAGALPVADAVRLGVRAVAHPDHVPEEIDRYWVIGEDRGPGMLFEWRDLDRTVVQFRPDTPIADDKGKEHKYVLPSGCGTFLSHLRPAAEDRPVLLVEGTKQGLAAAVWAPDGWGVVAVPGCDNWLGTDLTWAEDRKVVVLFDGDISTNRAVHDAATRLKEALEADGALEVVFAKLAGARAKEGLDDVLGRRPQDKRTDYIRRITEAAGARLGRPPARSQENPYFTEKGLLARTASLAVLEDQPAALASGSLIALYRDGSYRLERGREPLIERVKTLLGENFRPNWRSTIEEYLVGELHGRGLRLPDRQPTPLLNCANGMLNLVTGELMDHGPQYLSALQIPVPWIPDATCQAYERWLEQVIPEQLESLEEVASTMLDPSRTPGRALFGFGPSRSGKGTFLRILGAIAGVSNVSGVSLHQLSDNKFMSAAVYQKMVNISGDLSSAHVNDISLFKMMTGEDVIEADRKYGLPFRFTNQALFAFSANDLPTISETSRAYVNRIKPYRFGTTFAGREDPSIEDAMMAELPGILVRWVGRWQEFNDRGVYLPTDPAVAHEFETKSDRVSRWLATRCDVHEGVVGQLVGPDQGDTVSALYLAFKQWVKDDGTADAMSRPKFSERLRSVPGVGDVRLKHRNKNAGLNVTTHTGEDRVSYQIRTNGSKLDRSGVGSVGPQTLPLYVGYKDEMIKNSCTDSPTHDGDTGTGHTTHTSKGESDGTAGDEHEDGHGVPLHPGLHGDREAQEQPLDGFDDCPGGGGEGSPAVQALPPNPWDDAPAVTVRDGGAVGLDLETGSADAVFSYGPGYVRLVGIGTEDSVTAVPDTAVLEALRSADTIPCVNGALFDLPVLDVHCGIPVEETVPRAHDMRFVAFQQDPPSSDQTKPGPGFKSYSLDALLGRYLGRAKSTAGKELVKEFGGWDRIPVDDPRFVQYCRDDVADAHRLAAVLPLTDYDRREMKVAAITARATIEGCRIDLEPLKARVDRLAEQSAAGKGMLADRFGFPLVNKAGKPAAAPQRTAAGKQAFEAALVSFGIDVSDWPRGKDGTLSMAKEVMAAAEEWAAGQGHACLGVIHAVQEMNGIRSNAANLLRCAVGDRVHPRFEPFQTTGRWSIQDPGLTVTKPGAEDSERAFVLPEEGHVMVSIDMDQVDIRCVAAHSQDGNLIDIVNDPHRDIHSEISDMAFGSHEPGPRHSAKSLDLGWLYGRGIKGMVENTPGVTMEAAQRVDGSMRGRFTRVLSWQDEARDRAQGGLLDNGFGRRLRCQPGREYTQAPAMLGQSTTRDLIAEGLLDLARTAPEMLPMLRVIVHDEVVASVPEKDAEECARILQDCLSRDWAPAGSSRQVRFTAGQGKPFSFGRTWNQCYQ